MSANRSVGGLDDIDHLCLKVVKIVKSEARIVLYCIWNWGCERDLTVPFEDHAINVLKWDIIKYKKKFDNTMQTKIRNNPKGDEFDVTLLYACISSTCTRFSGSDMKTIIRPIAFFRNDVMHDDIVKDEASMNDAIAKIRQMLVDALNKAKEVYLVPENEIDGMIQRMDETIKEIKESPVPLHDIEDYRVKVKEHRKALEKLVEEKGVSCLKTTFKMLSNVDPASWISGKERLNIEMVYIRLEMKWKPNSDSSSYEPIGHESLLCQTYEDGIVPKIIVIQGEAGSGKSTLTKFILADWAKNSPSIIGLQEYDLILYVECKNRYISNFIDLLTSLMPQVSYEMTDTDFRRSVLEKKTLIIVDGLDEMNENSEKLLIEMLEIYQSRDDNRFQFIMTSRPQKIKIKETLWNKFPTVHIKIHGVPAERRVEFVQKLHDEMVKEGLSKEDTSKLVDYMKHSECRLQEHYRLPLNLTLLTYLWANDSKAVNSVTSATQLYVAVLNLLKSRVVSRIPNVYSGSIEVSMDTLLNRIFQVSLETHKRKSLELSEECYKKLEDECKQLNLPSVEILGAFFAVHDDYSVDCGPNKYNIFVPHKSIMEFFAANHIYSCLVENRADRCKEKLKAIKEEFPGIFKYQLVNEQPKTLRGVLETLLNDGKDLSPNILPHYQNTLIHLSGLLALQDKEALHKYGIELVDILEESEIKDSQWLDLLAEADCDSLLSTSIAEHISGKLVIEDGHTLAAIQLFKDLDSKTPVRVILQDEVKYIPQLDTLMEKLAERDCAVELLLNNHWKNPDNGLSTTYLEKLVNNSNCRVTRFTGNLDNIEMLPKDLEDVRLTISCNKQAELICKGIAELDKELHLSYIGIHVMKGVSPSFLKPLPVVKPNQKESGTIWLSDISDDDVSIACSLIKALHPPGMMFHSIMFPRCQLSLNGFECLLNELEQQQVKISKNIKSDSQVLGINEVPTLSKLTKKLFGRPFQRLVRNF